MTPNGPTEPPSAAPLQAIAGMGEEVQLAPRHGEALVRMVETAPAVSRRHQFFVWTQGALQTLLPHQGLCCGSYVRPRRALAYTVLHSVVLSPAVLAPLGDANSPLLRACTAAWVQGGGRALTLDAGRLAAEAQESFGALAHELPGLQLIVHGVARPLRAAEVESLFVFLCAERELRPGERALHAELVLPYLHATWRRVQATEATLGPPAAGAPGSAGAGAGAGEAGRPGTAGAALTEREREILRCAREGKSNLEIGLALDISALTVKNHIQKILRKLEANNRAHAVALAMAQGLL